MSEFNISKYLPEEVKQPELPTDDPTEKVTKEVKIAKLGEKSASEVIAKALIEALRREDIELIQKPDDSGNGIFSHVKIISTEDINNNFKGVMTDVNEGDIIVSDMFIPKTREEEMFDATVNESDITYFNNTEKAAKALINKLKANMKSVESEPVEGYEGIELRNLFPGDKVPIDGFMYEVVFRDSYVILFREETQHPTNKDNYLLVDCPKGV